MQKINFDFSALSNNQISNLVGNLSDNELQSYISQLQSIKAETNGVFDETAILNYDIAIEDLETKQAALLLSTQGIDAAHIQQILSIQDVTTAEQYQAIAESGLLKSKQALSNVELQNSITKVLSTQMSESDAKAKAGEVNEGEGAETVRHRVLEIRFRKTVQFLLYA